MTRFYDYQIWIARRRKTLGRCAELTTAMVKKFPELRRVRGHHFDAIWGRREHWWCIAPDGTIVDPTATQFPCKGTGNYVEHIEGSAEPTGKCLDCGEYVYNGELFCNAQCEESTRKYMQSCRITL